MTAPGGTDGRPAVAYLVSQYPWPSHVFIEREVAGLRALGARVETFSVHETPAAGLLGSAARDEAGRTTTVLDAHSVAASLRRLVVEHPRTLARVAGQAFRTGPGTVHGRIWQGFYLAEAAHLYSLMRDRGLRHVHVHLANNSADIARLAVALGRAVDGPGSGWRWTFTMHGPTEFEAVERFDLAAKVESAAAVACISDYTRSQLMKLVAPQMWPKLQVVRMSVDLDAYPLADRLPTADGPVRVLYVGRLVPEKGAPVLVDAVAALRRRGVPVTAVIVGAGPMEEELRQQVAAAELTDHVEIVGALGQDELPAAYAAADIFCLPSFQEGLPVVLMEAMATGLPCVTTAIAGIPELVRDRVTGRVLPPGRADLISEAIAELAGDRELRRTWGVEGRHAVENAFSLPSTARQQFAFLLDAASGGGG